MILNVGTETLMQEDSYEPLVTILRRVKGVEKKLKAYLHDLSGLAVDDCIAVDGREHVQIVRNVIASVLQARIKKVMDAPISAEEIYSLSSQELFYRMSANEIYRVLQSCDKGTPGLRLLKKRSKTLEFMNSAKSAMFPKLSAFFVEKKPHFGRGVLKKLLRLSLESDSSSDEHANG